MKIVEVTGERKDNKKKTVEIKLANSVVVLNKETNLSEVVKVKHVLRVFLSR